MTFETIFIGSGRRAALVLVAVVATFAASDAAFASLLGCLGDPVITGRTCPEAVCVALQADVNTFCKSGLLYSCYSLTDCEELRKMKKRWEYCARARDKINGICWGGGNAGHQQQAGQAWQNVSNCVAGIREHCEDPCPQLSGTSLRAPDAPSATVRTRSALEAATMEFMITVIERLAVEGKLDDVLDEGIDEKAGNPGSAIRGDDDPPADSQGADGRND